MQSRNARVSPNAQAPEKSGGWVSRTILAQNQISEPSVETKLVIGEFWH